MTLLERIFQTAEQKVLDYKEGSLEAYEDCAAMIDRLVDGIREDVAAATTPFERTSYEAHMYVLTAVAKKIRNRSKEFSDAFDAR